MNILIILAHPGAKSFNHALAHTVRDALNRDGHAVVLHDLCAEKFDPCLPADETSLAAILPASIRQHCDELMAADGIVVVHPNWWGQPPAILKGWVDRVIRPGVAYRFLEGDDGEGVPVGLLNAGTALVLNTANTPADRELEIFGDPLQRTWADCVFGLCGVSDVRRRVFGVVVSSTAEQRAAWIDDACSLALECFGQ
jgi:NAD(P)H dehydrogenase (quinone)